MEKLSEVRMAEVEGGCWTCVVATYYWAKQQVQSYLQKQFGLNQ